MSCAASSDRRCDTFRVELYALAEAVLDRATRPGEVTGASCMRLTDTLLTCTKYKQLDVLLSVCTILVSSTFHEACVYSRILMSCCVRR